MLDSVIRGPQIRCEGVQPQLDRHLNFVHQIPNEREILGLEYLTKMFVGDCSRTLVRFEKWSTLSRPHHPFHDVLDIHEDTRVNPDNVALSSKTELIQCSS